MRAFRDLPIGRKLVTVGVAASALALIVSSLIFLLFTFFALRESVRSELEAQAAIVADNTSASLAFKDPAAASETVRALGVTRYVDMACLFALDGRLFTSYVASPNMSCPATMGASTPDVDTGFSVSKQVQMRGQRYGTLYLKGNFNQVWSRLLAQSIAAVAGILLGGLAAMLLSARIQRIISKPIVDLSSTAARISQVGDYSLRATRQGDDEIGELVETFNRMVAEVARRDEQLRAASRLKDEFLATLSHELRTPLNAVLGWIQILRATPADAALTTRAYASIERNARAQTTLIEDLLDISRIVTGKLHFLSESVDLVMVVEAALEVVRPAAEAKNITVARNLLPSPQLVNGDPHRLQQVAWNLLSNAVKFTSAGGSISVTLEAADATYVLAVADDGIGLDPAFLPHVFDRFRQADGSMTRPHGGLGLGLAIARELTELHGGHIGVTSRGGGTGATFTVTLPRPSLRPLPPAARPKSGDARLDGISVIVVDDDEDTRELARVIVNGAGGRATAMATASEVLEALATRETDVILCDLAMPGIDGYELVRLLRVTEQSQRRPRLPALAVSAHAGAAAETRARESGFDGFVAKPYNVEALVALIADVAGSRAK